MTTLAANLVRAIKTGGVTNDLPIIASDIIYEGAAVGLVSASGHARPLTSVDAFAGFATRKTDNSSGAAAALNAEVFREGIISLPVTGALITDVGLPVYASDDNAFSFNPVGGVYVGDTVRFVEAGVMEVQFDVGRMKDPFEGFSIRETLTGTKTFDIQDNSKLFAVTADGDGDALTLPAVAAGLGSILIYAVGAFGTTALTISPNANDSIAGPDAAATDDSDLILTKATQRRGDYVWLGHGDADGYHVKQLKGTWAKG